MKIGIPRAFLYYRYGDFWKTFFRELGAEVVVSPETNKEILRRGGEVSIDESCLSSKIYLGHIDYLIGKCDYILIPRIASYKKKSAVTCSKFQAAYDVASNIFRDRGIKILVYNIDYEKGKKELSAFLKLGKELKKSKFATVRAYFMAKQSEKTANEEKIKAQNALLDCADKLKILIVAHSYNVHDAYIGRPILRMIECQGCVPILADAAPREESAQCAGVMTPTLKWQYSKELVGAVSLYKDKIDGIILVTAFPCGPDSMVNEMLIRRTKDKPIIALTVDAQDGTAGIETRIESFVDIIRFKRGIV